MSRRKLERTRNKIATNSVTLSRLVIDHFPGDVTNGPKVTKRG